MNTTISSRFLTGVLLAGVLTFFLSPAATAADTDHESQCFKNVQGKIPWNDDKNMNWEPENVKQLCKGTSKPTEPGECFLAVNSGHVKWGKTSKGGEWEWKNVINLCSGTDNAKETVECFNQGISTDADWRDVILTCQRKHNNVVDMN